MPKIKNTNHIVTHGWMRNELNLSGLELSVYAIIYGFSQTQNQWCTASQEYFADWTGATVRGIRKAIESLIEKGYLEKTYYANAKGKGCAYKALMCWEEPEELSSGMSRNSVPQQQELSSGSRGTQFRNNRNSVPVVEELSSYNNIDNNIEDNKDNNKEGANAPAPQKSSRFSKPSITEIAAYCAEKNISIDPQQFYYFYEAKGWKIGNSPMKNWKAAVQTWVKRGRNSYGNSYSAKPNNCGHNNPEGFDEI